MNGREGELDFRPMKAVVSCLYSWSSRDTVSQISFELKTGQAGTVPRAPLRCPVPRRMPPFGTYVTKTLSSDEKVTTSARFAGIRTSDFVLVFLALRDEIAGKVRLELAPKCHRAVPFLVQEFLWRGCVFVESKLHPYTGSGEQVIKGQTHEEIGCVVDSRGR